jgi:predicted outer membrane repeat protein
VISNTLITENTATNGGGIYTYIGSPYNAEHGIYLRLNNVTIAGNTGTTNGGGIFNINSSSAHIDVTANNSVIWGNLGGGQNIFDDNSKITYDHCLVQGLTLNGTGASQYYTSGTGNLDPNSITDDSTVFTTNYHPGSDLINNGDDAKVISLVGDATSTGLNELLAGMPTWSINSLKENFLSHLGSSSTIDFDLFAAGIQIFSEYLDTTKPNPVGDRRGTYNGSSFSGSILTLPPRIKGTVDIGAWEAE